MHGTPSSPRGKCRFCFSSLNLLPDWGWCDEGGGERPWECPVRPEICPCCGGTGWHEPDDAEELRAEGIEPEPLPCNTCRTTGYIYDPHEPFVANPHYRWLRG